jgi:hypothetical protein
MKGIALAEEDLMLEIDRERIRANVQAATTQDLLDRATVYRDGMEPEALELIEEELRQRGVTAAQQIDHQTQYEDTLRDGEGLPLYCDYCDHLRPAVWRGWRWYWWWGLVPLFPIRVALCARHAGLEPPSPGITSPEGSSPRPPAE